MRLNWKNLCVLALLLIALLTTASCASTQSGAKHFSASQEVSRQHEKETATTGLAPELNKLIGIWEGTVSSPTNPGWGRRERVLIIGEFGNQLYARYGLTREKMFRVKLEVTISNGTPQMYFRSSPTGRVALRLIEDNWLLGTLTVTEAGSYSLSLVKVKP